MEKQAMEIASAIKGWWKANGPVLLTVQSEPEFVGLAKQVLGDWDQKEGDTEVLQAYDVAKLANGAGAEIWPTWLARLEGPLAAPVHVPVIVTFRDDAPDAWEELMSRPTTLQLTVGGTRISSGSGALDGSLKACYAARLDAVNAKRATLGLSRVSP